MTFEQAKQTLADTLALRKSEISTLIETRKIEMQINLLNSPLYTSRQLEEADTLQLTALLSIITDNYAVDDRKVINTYGFGVVPNKLITILKSIQFSKLHEKQELLIQTNLSESLIEELLEAIGGVAYFSAKFNAIVPAIPMDIPKVREKLHEVSQLMGLVAPLNLSKFNASNIEYIYTKASIDAENALENHLRYKQVGSVEYTE